ncbi:MAG: SpoIIE family protein phosphatase [Phycisphaerae bacterium]|nr:SpoIIE family protein phosphatase [Phycisphaerae bacterium]
MAQLRYLDQAGNLQTINLGEGPFLIGRNNTCQLVFIDDMVSREHTRIDHEKGGRYRIRDLGSRNKTHVNGQVVNETLLQPNDFIRIGDHVLEFVDEGALPKKLELDFLTPDRRDPEGSDWIKAKSPLTLTSAQIEQLSGLSADLGITARSEDVADAGLERLMLDVQAERGFVAMRGEGKKDIRVITHRGLAPSPTSSRTPVSETFVYNAILQQVCGRYPADSRKIDPKAGYAATALVAPLLFRGTIVGLIYVDRPATKKPFSKTDLQYTTAAGAHLGRQMANASARLAHNATREGAAWLSTLRRLQTAMATVPRDGTLFDVACKLFPGQGRCGDFCDVLELTEHRTAVIVLDGGGQGIAGLVQAAAIRSGIVTALKTGGEELDIAELMTALNRSLANQRTRQLVTCTLVLLDVASAQVTYINAGGMPPLLLTGPGRLVTLDQPALLLGIDEEYPYESTTVDLTRQFRLICHTDGLVDAVNAADDGFGEQRLHETLLNREAFASPAEIIGRLGDALEAHIAGNPLVDDALVCVLSKD